MIPFLIPALIAGGSTLISAIIQGVSATKAAEAQAAAAEAGIEATSESSAAALAELQSRYDDMQAQLQPYTEAGTQALTAQSDLAGLNGAEAQRAAIAGIESSPEMAAMSKQGEEAILQNAAATGGLRGGNTQGALAQLRPAILSQLINQQYSRLGGLTSMGQASAAGVGAAGMSAGGSAASLMTGQGATLAQLLQQQGAAQAGGLLAAGQGWNGIPNGLMAGMGMYTGLGGKW